MINIKNGQGGGQMKLSKSVLIAIIAVAAIGCLNRTVQFVELCLILRQHSVHDGISRVVSDLTLSFLAHSHHLFSVWSIAGFDLTPR